MLLDLAGRVVVVSGGGRGIGRALVDRFRAEGAVVVALDLELPDPVDGVQQVRCDVTDEDDVRAAVDDVVRRHGRLDVLVNNAGILPTGLVEDMDVAAWRRCLDVNTTGTFLLCRAAVPVMKRQRAGRILNAASFAAVVPSVSSAAYAASKAAIIALTRVLASEVGPWGITVNAYAPGMVPTAMNGFAELDQGAQDRLLDTLSLRRWGTPDEVADLLCFLASDAAGYITGTMVEVTGGKLATQFPSRAHELARDADA